MAVGMLTIEDSYVDHENGEVFLLLVRKDYQGEIISVDIGVVESDRDVLPRDLDFLKPDLISRSAKHGKNCVMNQFSAIKRGIPSHEALKLHAPKKIRPSWAPNLSDALWLPKKPDS